MSRPLKVTLWIHREADIRSSRANVSAFKRYLDDAVTFFRPLSIDMDYKQGQQLPLGTTWDDMLWHWDENDRLKHENSISGRANVALVLAKEFALFDTSTNGLLSDSNHRSIAVLFTEATAFNGSDEQTFQILIHELGHVFNLVHSESLNPSRATGETSSAMNQEEERPNDRAKLLADWRKILDDEPYDARDVGGLEQFFKKHKQEGRLLGLPFSPVAVNYLRRHLPVADVLPWRTPFRDAAADGQHDWGNPGLQCHIVFERDDFGVGEPLDFKIEIENLSSSKSYRIPVHLGMKFGNVSLSVFGPDHVRQFFRSRTKICADGARMLNSGEKMARSFSLLHADKGVLLSKPGDYVIDVSFPSLPIYKVTVPMNVRPARTNALADHYFQRFLGSALRSRSKRSWRMLDDLLSDTKTIPAAVRNHFALLYATRQPAASRSAELFLSCLENHQGVRSHEKALLMTANPMRLPKRWREYDRTHIREKARQHFASLDNEYPLPTNLWQALA